MHSWKNVHNERKKTLKHYGYEKDLIINVLKIVQRWCVTKRLMVNLLKTNVLVFMRKYKPEPTQALRVGGKETVFTSTVKYSGDLLDPKLNWKQHPTARRKKFYSSMWVCRRTMGKTYGISTEVALWMHGAVLLPKILYVSVVWWPMVSRVEV
jgi:hypothetical protein